MNRIDWTAIIVAALGAVSAALSRLIGRNNDKPATPPQEVPPAPPPRADGQITADAHARVDAAAALDVDPAAPTVRP